MRSRTQPLSPRRSKPCNPITNFERGSSSVRKRWVEQVQGFDTRGLLKRVLRRANGEVLPLENTGSGPIRNELQPCDDEPPVGARSRQTSGPSCSIYATEGPGDYQPAPEDLERHPEATRLFRRRTTFPTPDIVIDRCGPLESSTPPVGSPAILRWEESRIPSPMVEDSIATSTESGSCPNLCATCLRGIRRQHPYLRGGQRS